MSLDEPTVKDVTPSWFAELGFAVGLEPLLALGEPTTERDSSGDVLRIGRLREDIWRRNTAIPEDSWEEAPRNEL